MNVTIFGATGGTGSILAEKSLAAGFSVTALVRDPNKFAQHGKCRVIVGDAREAGPVAEAVRGSHAVMSTLGAKSPFEKSDLLSRAMPQIIAAMRREGIRRLIVLGSGGWQFGSLRNESVIRRALLMLGARTVLKHPIASQRAQESAVLQSQLDWTIIAPPRLLNSQGRGPEHARINTEAMPKGASRIAREDVAAIMFRALIENAWVRRRVYVTW